MIYLATPYSDSNPVIREERYRLACSLTTTCVKEKVPCYCPIAFWVPIAEEYGLITSAAFFMVQNDALLAKCEELWIITMEGWNRSIGIEMERAEFQRIHNSAKDVYHYTAGEVYDACLEYHGRLNTKRDALVEDAMKTATAQAGLGTPTDLAPGQAILIGGQPAVSGVGGQVQLPGGMKKDT